MTTVAERQQEAIKALEALRDALESAKSTLVYPEQRVEIRRIREELGGNLEFTLRHLQSDSFRLVVKTADEAMQGKKE